MTVNGSAATDVRSFRHGRTSIIVGEGALAAGQADLFDCVGRRPLVIVGASASLNTPFMSAIASLWEHCDGHLHVKRGSSKSLDIVEKGVRAYAEGSCTGVIAVGGGDALDLGKQVSHYAYDLSRLTSARCGEHGSQVPGADREAISLGVIPAELAGSGLSAWASALPALSGPSDGRSRGSLPVRGGLRIAIYDTDVFTQTPREILRQSYFNGLNKGIETLYSGRTNPLSDATATAGVRLMLRNISSLMSAGHSPVTRELLDGIILVQLHRRLSVIHAVCHGLSRIARVPQGVSHAIMGPIILRGLLPQLPSSVRRRVADAVIADPYGDIETVPSELEAVRASLGLAGNLNAFGVETISKSLLDYISQDTMLQATPEGVDTSLPAITHLLRQALAL